MWPFSSADNPVASVNNPNPALQFAGIGSSDGATSGFASGGDAGWLNKASSPALVQALQDASKSSVFNPKEPPPLAAARPIDVPAGRPRQAASLDQLVQLLEKQRAQYGTLSGQPVAQQQVLGLLGF